MKPGALFIIDSDPRSNGRAAEAIRIAAGIGVWQKMEITVYLRGPAVQALCADAAGLVDEENYERYLPLLKICIQQGAWLGGAESRTSFTEISDAQLAELAARQTQVLRF
jgi:hypothetical protein